MPPVSTRAGRPGVTAGPYNELAGRSKVLARAIDSGGTTLRDFIGGDGKPGYFQQELFVYGRAGQLCKVCGATLSECRLGQRSSVFCRRCQS